MANQKIIDQKKNEVSELAEKIKTAKLVLLADYRGVNVEDITSIRANLRKTNSE